MRRRFAPGSDPSLKWANPGSLGCTTHLLRTSVALFGRGQQLDVLAAQIDGVRTGGGAVLVRGAAGIGKSALLAEAAARAAATGCTVVRVLGDQAGAGVPYAGLQQFAHSLDAAQDTLAEPQRSALAAALGQGEGMVPDVFLVALATLNLVV